jgi:hypothetical protein
LNLFYCVINKKKEVGFRMARRKTKPDEGPRAPQILTEEQIRRKVLVEQGFGHPLTKVGIAFAVVFGIFALFAFLSSTFVQLLFVFAIVAGVFMLLTTGNLFYNFKIKGKETIASLVREMSRLNAQREADAEEERLSQLVRELKVGYQNAVRERSSRGDIKDMAGKALTELEELVAENANLIRESRIRESDDVEEFAKIQTVAARIYNAGLEVHRDGVIPFLRVLGDIDEDKLRRELVERENELSKLEEEGAGESLMVIARQYVESHRQRLERAGEIKERITENVFKSDLCETEIRGAKNDIIDMRDGKVRANADALQGRLDKVSGFAKDLQNRMNDLTRMGIGV